MATHTSDRLSPDLQLESQPAHPHLQRAALLTQGPGREVCTAPHLLRPPCLLRFGNGDSKPRKEVCPQFTSYKMVGSEFNCDLPASTGREMFLFFASATGTSKLVAQESQSMHRY